MPSPGLGVLVLVGTTTAVAFNGPGTGSLSLSGDNLEPRVVTTGAGDYAPSAATVVVSGSGTAVAFKGPGTGSLGLVGQQPNVGRNNPIFQPAASALTLLGQQVDAPQSGNNQTRSPAAGALAWAGSYTEVDFKGPDEGALTLAGIQPLVVRGGDKVMLPGAYALSATGQAVTVYVPFRNPAAGSFAFVGTTPTLKTAYITPAGALVVAGQSLTVPRGPNTFQPATASLSLSGSMAGPLIEGLNLFTPSIAGLSLTGRSVTLLFTVPADIPTIELLGRLTDEIDLKGRYRRGIYLIARAPQLRTSGYTQYTTYAADAFVDSIGVNIRVSYYDTPYGDFTSTKAALIDLGVRHIRDGVLTSEGVGGDGYYSRHAQLGSAGIYGIYVASLTHSQSDIETFASRVSPTLEALEGPNEWDLNGGVSWATNLAAYLPTVKAAGTALGVSVVGPSLTTDAAYTELGNQSAYLDYACLHNYYGNTNYPEHGSITQALVNAGVQGPSKPIYTTENGWYTDSALTDYLSEATQAKYIVRMLLEQYRRGITRTYIHELIDFDNASTPPPVLYLSGYGLMRYDFTPKPAYTAVQSLIELLSDTSGVTVTNMAYLLTGGNSDLRAMPFQKQDGSYWLALWVALGSASSQMVSLSVTGRIVNTHAFQSDGTIAVTSQGGVTTATLTVTDTVQVVEVRT